MPVYLLAYMPVYVPVYVPVAAGSTPSNLKAHLRSQHNKRQTSLWRKYESSYRTKKGNPTQRIRSNHRNALLQDALPRLSLARDLRIETISKFMGSREIL
jgi:hypothetical protein